LSQINARAAATGDDLFMMKQICIARTILALVTGAVLAMVNLAAAHAQDYAWEDGLRRQLLSELNCELNYLTDVREFELLGKKSVLVRAHCNDKRAFDASREGGEETFRFRSCEIVTC
jgi:hypothetical protein